MIPYKIKVCFLGTPEFAAVHLQALLNDPQYEVVGVITQPDRPAGRKMQLTPSAVKALAQKNNIPVLTPENLRKQPDVFDAVKLWQAEVAVVVAFGQILSQEFLDFFKYGAVNIHGSLLPLYRGAAPIQRCLENGDRVTGVSLQKMVFKLDAGAVISESKINLDSEINATELYQKLSILGCELLRSDLIKYINKKITPTMQDESKVTVAHKILKTESLLDFSLPAEKFHNKVRAFSMGPGTYVMLQGKRLKIHKSKIINGLGAPAEIINVTDNELIIGCSEHLISLIEVQPESKPKIKISDFLKSSGFKKGDLFQ
jgi:methionyl-tRNA formyltransferase